MFPKKYAISLFIETYITFGIIIEISKLTL